MPYPNEHACRLRNPKDFQADSFRRDEREHDGKKYGVIFGRLKGKTAITEQAYRYNKKTWTAAEAKSHCAEHKGKFEAAAKEQAVSILPNVWGRIWAIIPETLREMAASLAEQQHELVGATARPSQEYSKIAILPLWGVINHKPSLLSMLFGGTSLEGFGAYFRAAVSDPTVKAIVLDVDSPGGEVAGTHEMAREIFAARSTKPIYAMVNTLSASAAYWISAAADKIWMTPSGLAGSIGVYALHEDKSGADEKGGIKHTIIKAGKYKEEANPFEPLSDDAKAALQQMADDAYDMMTADIAEFRGVSQRKIQNGYGEGRVLGAKRALNAGMVDKIATSAELMRYMARRVDKPRTRTKRAELDRQRQVL